MRDFHKPGRSAVFASNAMCATSHPFAAREAVALMEAGGNAVDGAICAAVLLGLCEPASTGIGGDMFALIKPAGTEDVKAFNASGRAPMALSAALLRDQGEEVISIDSPHAVSVPGAIDGFCKLSEDWGCKGLAAALAPSIRYAETGVPVGPRTAFDWNGTFHRLKGDAVKFYGKDGAAYQVGDVFKHPGQADVLRRIAEQGRVGFYEGDVAEDMVASLNALGGLHTMEDFAATEAEYVEPISAAYKDVELVEHPPNGQGITALLLAKILSHFDIASLDPLGWERAHIEAEATKLAYDARSRFVGDFEAAGPLMERMLDDGTAMELADLISMDRVMATPPAEAAAVHKDTEPYIVPIETLISLMLIGYATL
ncbi:MAG: gamma-glutamyltransferase, partial [Pseudomonadota bacterium]